MKPVINSPSRRSLLAELSIKLSVNAVAIAVAGATLMRLLPYHFSQSAKLHEIRLEVDRTQIRVDRLRDKFHSSFAPEQSSDLVEEGTHLSAKDRLPVFWLNENSSSERD